VLPKTFQDIQSAILEDHFPHLLEEIVHKVLHLTKVNSNLKDNTIWIRRPWSLTNTITVLGCFLTK
jgi:hypothetical protein